MDILLVEDDDNKRSQLEAFLRETTPGASVDCARSLQSGLRQITSHPYDLVLLDMTLPTFDIGVDEDGGRPQAYGGRELLRQMERRGLATPVIVVTQFSRFGEGSDARTLGQLHQQLQAEHPRTYQGRVFYDAGVSGWQEALAELIERTRSRPGR